MALIRNAFGFVVATVFMFALLEGLGSLALAAFKLTDKRELASPSAYDPELGWVGEPNVNAPNFYGPGIGVRTNAQGFRNAKATNDSAPTGTLRAICSGDSFTFGQGVANEHTWCHLLSVRNPRLDTVNLGQPGYGIDQMYLQYIRESDDLAHSIHIFAFVDGDLERMGRDFQHNHGKPVLTLSDGELVVGNVPVPELRWQINDIVERADLRSIDLGRKIHARLTGSQAIQRKPGAIKPLAQAVFSSVHRLGVDREIDTLFVFLPTERDIGADTAWRTWVNTTMAELDVEFIDLTPALREVPAPELIGFFIPDGMPGDGHYTETGNAWAADRLIEKLNAIPRMKERLQALDRP